MDYVKTGALIRRRRKAKGLTQRELAELIGVGDKAVSKWERGLGFPDVGLLSELSRVLGAELESLLTGQTEENDPIGGNMKKLKIYVCPKCGNLMTASCEAAVSCCGEKLRPTEPRRAEPEEELTVETVENDYYITSGHEMTKEHYITFVALLTGDTVFLRKLYPEWDMQTRIPRFAHGRLLWYCTRHGLMYKNI